MWRTAAYFALLAIVGSVAYFWFVTRTNQPIDQVSSAKMLVHVAGSNEIDIRNVTAKVVYFAPANLTSSTNWLWKDHLEKTMEKQKNFFGSQLGINLRYLIFDKVVIGNKNLDFYDGEDTSHGNKNALISVRKEIISRLFEKNGDLFSDIFSSRSGFEILVIVFEGTGASAMTFKNQSFGEDVLEIKEDGPPAVILSSAFLNSPHYKDFGETVLAHELAHTFGLSDGYDPVSGANRTEDLMGEGRRRTLKQVFISDENKKLLGAF